MSIKSSEHMKPKKILYIGGFQLPDKNAAAHRVISNGKIFRDLGHDVTFFGTTSSQAEIGSTLIKKSFEGFTYYSMQYPKTLINWYFYLIKIDTVKSFIKTYMEGIPDAIIAYNYPSVALNRLRRFCRSNNIKLYADCTEWYEGQGNVFTKTMKNLDTNFRMKYVQPKLNGVIVISKFLFDYYKAKKNKQNKFPPIG